MLNNAPTITGLGLAGDPVPTFTEGDGLGALVDTNVKIVDADLAALNATLGDYPLSTLTVQRQGPASLDDQFGFLFADPLAYSYDSGTGIIRHIIVTGSIIAENVVATVVQSNGQVTVGNIKYNPV